MSQDVENRIARLSDISARRVIEPDDAVTGQLATTGPILARELLSIAGLDLELTDQQLEVLAREEVAAITDAGVRFEALLIAGFARQLADAADLSDPRTTYVLHELGEETRHSRLFIRLLDQLHPEARNPFTRGPLAVLDHVLTSFVLSRPALFCVFVLAGEEVPDLFQRRASEDPATDPFLRAVNVYHRAEEARHLAYARIVLPELWQQAGRRDRFLVRWVAPLALRAVFDSLVHPGVYAVAGLPGWSTWRAARRTHQRIEFRNSALAGVASALADAGAFTLAKPPRPWRRLLGETGP